MNVCKKERKNLSYLFFTILIYSILFYTYLIYTILILSVAHKCQPKSLKSIENIEHSLDEKATHSPRVASV